MCVPCDFSFYIYYARRRQNWRWALPLASSIPGLGALAVRDEVMGREGYQCVAKRV